MVTVIIEWECLRLSHTNRKKYIIRALGEAIYLKDKGWICDCGKWTTGDDKTHIPRIKGMREIYKPQKKKSYDYKNMIF